jgi:apolipoprotein N-acyltransferase
MSTMQLVLLVTGGLFSYLWFGGGTLQAAPWVGSVLLLRFARTTPGWSGMAAIAATLSLAEAIANWQLIPAPGFAYFVIIAAEAICGTLPFLADRHLARSPAFASTLIFPLTWVTIDFLTAHIPSKGTWDLAPYTQYGNLPLMQLVSVTGLSGITFVIGWFAAVVNWAWERGFVWKEVEGGVLGYAAALGAVLLGGYAWLATGPAAGKSVRMAVVSSPPTLLAPGEATRMAQGKVGAEERERLRTDLGRVHDWLIESATKEARAGARLVAWPEIDALVFAEDEQALIERGQRLAACEGVYVLMGVGVIHPGASRPLENKAVLLGPTGGVVFAYRKSRPAPNWEATVMDPGDGRMRIADTEFGRVATAICFEMDFPDYIRQAGLASADVLIAPANDWEAIKSIHFRMAVFRAIENGVTLIRPTKSGISVAVDPYGRVSAQTDHFARGARTMVAQLPASGVRTFYARFGDVFAWLCLVSLLAVAGAALETQRLWMIRPPLRVECR